jgi:hypothetical protein
MKTYHIILSSVLISASFISCEKVIDIDLNSKDPQYIVEAEVTDDTTLPQTVYITKSLNFSESSGFPTVSNATVELSDNTGTKDTLKEVKPGVYQSFKIKGIQGRTYYLKVESNGKSFSATCKMPKKVNLDSLQSNDATQEPGQSGVGKAIRPVFTDPSGKGNAYRFKLIVNSKTSKDILIHNDNIVDGLTYPRSFGVSDITIKTNDSVSLVFMCIDPQIHFYFNSLFQNAGGPGGSASPANPKTNMQGGALGYFSAHTRQVKSIIIK